MLDKDNYEYFFSYLIKIYFGYDKLIDVVIFEDKVGREVILFRLVVLDKEKLMVFIIWLCIFCLFNCKSFFIFINCCVFWCGEELDIILEVLNILKIRLYRFKNRI